MAQCNFVFRGQIVSSGDNTSLPLATIELLSENRSTVSDENGMFIIEDLCHQLITIRVRYVGFRTFEGSVDLGVLQESSLIKMEIESKDLAEVTIEAKKAHFFP